MSQDHFQRYNRSNVCLIMNTNNFLHVELTQNIPPMTINVLVFPLSQATWLRKIMPFIPIFSNIVLCLFGSMVLLPDVWKEVNQKVDM